VLLGFGPAGLDLALVFLMDAVVWLAVVAALLWLAFHYFPELREAIRHPGLAHQAADDIQNVVEREVRRGAIAKRGTSLMSNIATV
jgi:hypothetical protein